MKPVSKVAVIFGVLAAWLSGKREGVEIVALALKELLFLLPWVLIVSAIPARNRCGPIFYSFLIPILLITLAVTAHMQD